MGKKLDAFLGKISFKKSKFSNLVNLAVSRIAALEKQHHVRCGQARSDVIQLLNLGHQERALLRVEVVIREQNMLDAYAMIENYFHLLVERVVLVQNNKECPNELKEAISSLVYAASRCGELPELQKIRSMFTSRFGKEFTTRAVELCTNCGVNPKIVKKLSTRRLSLDSKLKMLKEIAPTNEIAMHLKRESSLVTEEEKLDVNRKQKQPEPNKSANLNNPQLQAVIDDLPDELKQDSNFSKTMEARKKYSDFGAAAAAEAAFILASQAAAAARAAVELSQPQYKAHDDGSSKSDPQSYRNAALEGKKHINNEFNYDKIHDIENLSSKLAAEKMADNNYSSHVKETGERSRKAEVDKELSASSLSPIGDNMSGRKKTSQILSQNEMLGKERGFVRFSDRNTKNQDTHDRKSNEQKFQTYHKASTIEGESSLESTNHKDFAKHFDLRLSNIGRRPLSSRSRQRRHSATY
ncbi:uncharacterized protein LOC112025847 [Quercus suber]|uniref:uncharacterized protein LOC112025847 n=1 Tax=Quercus suber TaxID=58331 RepID=UPI000CE1698A|nr:uncharacterized protein LOC112025847 [Quercus suber]POF08354.1 ist1-like protein [Quercus suber]